MSPGAVITPNNPVVGTLLVKIRRYRVFGSAAWAIEIYAGFYYEL